MLDSLNHMKEREIIIGIVSVVAILYGVAIHYLAKEARKYNNFNKWKQK